MEKKKDKSIYNILFTEVENLGRGTFGPVVLLERKVDFKKFIGQKIAIFNKSEQMLSRIL